MDELGNKEELKRFNEDEVRKHLQNLIDDGYINSVIYITEKYNKAIELGFNPQITDKALNSLNWMAGFELVRNGLEDGINFRQKITVLCLGTLALSLQYSPSFGNRYWGFLIFSWLCFLFASILGGVVMHKCMQFKFALNTVTTEDYGDKFSRKKMKKYDLIGEIQLILLVLGIVFNMMFVILNHYLAGNN